MKKILLTLMLLFSFTSVYADNCDEKNFDLAACLLDAEQGRAEAQHTIGMLYEEGKGERVPQDDVKAHLYFSLATTNGNQYAVANRGKLVKEMTPDQIEKAEDLAIQWAERHP